jgi:hypothetical protein
MSKNGNADKSGILIFASYSTKDVDTYRIRAIAEKLTDFEEIEDVLYWQEDMHDNIFKFMNDNLGRCDVMLLFCSKNAINSIPVEKEWTAADSLGKPIIPIFTKIEEIPPLLSSRLGVKFDTYNFQETIQSLHDLILKKSLENTALFVEYHTDENSEAYTTLMWFDKKKNYIKLRRITGHPLKIKEIYNNILVVYKFRKEIHSFEEFFIDPDTKLSDLLDGDEIILFIDAKSHTVWYWIGDFVNKRMKFIIAKMTPTLRDMHWINFKIRSAHQGDEPIEFLNMLGIEKEKHRFK